MIGAVVLFVLGVLTVFLAQNALRGPGRGLPWWARPLWLPATLSSELIPTRMAVTVAVFALCAWGGALRYRVGRAGAVLVAIGWIGFTAGALRARRATAVMADALERPVPGPVAVGPVRSIVRYPFTLPRGVDRMDDVRFGYGDCTLDVYRSAASDGRSVLVQVHGGGWTGGNKRQQARPLLHHFAHAGWTCVAVSYPLDPRTAAFPDRVVAVKRAIAWLRSDAVTVGIDPDFVALTGGSAGAHLASLAALTGPPEFQPGFEDADTRVDACVPLYGIYDFLNRNATRDDWPVIPRAVMQATPNDAPDRYRTASPLDRVHADAPPFLVIHGSHDSLVPPAEARQFVVALAAVSSAPVHYAEIPGGGHSFDLVPSGRTRRVIAGIETFLVDLRARTRGPGGIGRDRPGEVSPRP